MGIGWNRIIVSRPAFVKSIIGPKKNASELWPVEIAKKSIVYKLPHLLVTRFVCCRVM